MIRSAAAVAGALVLVLAIHVVLIGERVLELTLQHVFEIDRHLNYGELLHYAVLGLLGAPAALLLASAWSEHAWARCAALAERAGFWLPSLVAGLGAACISRFVTHGAWFTDDEQAYMFQMESYRRLQLALPALQPEHVFHHPFVVVSRIRDNTPYWSGIYPVLQPALMTLSRTLGNPLISQWCCAAAIAYHTGRLCERLAGARRLGILAAWLCATSPMLLGLAATYHTSVPCCLLSVLGVRALLGAQVEPRFGRGLLVGLCAGAAFLTRGLEGTLLIVVFGAVLSLRALRAQRLAWQLLAGYAAACALAGAAYVAVNRATTGEWLTTSYAVWGTIMGRIMGFGPTGTMMWGRAHTPLLGATQTFTTLTRMNTWLFGWPVSVLLPLCALLRPFRERAATYLLAFSGLQLAGYFFLPFGSVHDFGAAYHVWHVPWFACVTMILAKNARALLPRGTRLIAALSLLGLLAFWPVQIERWRAVADHVLSPVRAAEQAAGAQPAVVLWRLYNPPNIGSWVNHPPAPNPYGALLWMQDVPGAEQLARQLFPERRLLRLVWEGTTPRVLSLAPPPS